MKKYTVWMFTGLVCVFLAAAVVSAGDYDHRIDVEKMSCEWRSDGQQLFVRLKAPTTGWVGIGFNPSEKMKDADFVIGYVKEGAARVTDHYGISKQQHQKDTKLGGQSTVTDPAGTEIDGVTEISFAIPLNSGDPKDQPLILDTDTTVLLAYGSGRDSFRARHKFRTALTVNLATGVWTEVK